MFGKIWSNRTRKAEYSLTGHKGCVKMIKWGGEGYIYSASEDRTIRMWDTKNGTCIKILQGHAHWVNYIALSTEHAMKMGPFNEYGMMDENIEQAQKYALQKYNEIKDVRGELLVSASDDFTLYLWNPCHSGFFIFYFLFYF